MNSIELLAPAGDRKSLEAAVIAGADAVYFGAKHFSARAFSANFELNDAIAAVEYCKIRGVKAYITINTLIKDIEIKDLYDMVTLLYRNGADAFIVQDLGVINILKDYVPLHASTQLTVHTIEGARILRRLGLKRVILSRELSCKQINEIAEENIIETEIFVHGSLCVSYSGQCLMSSIIGRRSGNRGKCAQPCRMPYSIVKRAVEGNENDRSFDLNYGQDNKYFLSLKDLCLIDQLQEIKNVTSVKIEGRMKNPEYVKVVTYLYKKYLTSGKKVSKEDIELLQKVFSRGFTKHYFNGQKDSDIFNLDGNKQEFNIDLDLKEKKIPLKAKIIIKKDEPAHLTFIYNKLRVDVKSENEAKAALKFSLTDEIIKKQISKVNPFEIVEFEIIMDSDLNMPLKELNELRRNALSKLIQEIIKKPSENYTPIFSAKPVKKILTPKINVQVRNMKQLRALQKYRNIINIVYIGIDEITNEAFNYFDNIVAVLPRISYKNYEKNINKMQEMGIIGICIGNIGQIEFCTNPNFSRLKFFADFGLNVYNIEAVKLLESFGIKFITLSLELNERQIEYITGSSGLEFEIYSFGLMPLMYTESCPVKILGSCPHNLHFKDLHQNSGFSLKDRTSEEFPVLTHCGECRAEILNSKYLYIRHANIQNMRVSFTIESPYECVVFFENYINDIKPDNFTYGHYKRGVT